MQVLSRFDRMHPRSTAGVRVVVGIWLLVGAAVACLSGYLWGLVILAPAALNFYLAYRALNSR